MARKNDRGLDTYSDNDYDDTWNCNEENGDDLGININPFKSDNQAEDMYDERKPHLFIKFADDRYLLQGISDETGSFVRGNYAIVRCIRLDLPQRKDSYVCDCDLSRANQVTDMRFEARLNFS